MAVLVDDQGSEANHASSTSQVNLPAKPEEDDNARSPREFEDTAMSDPPLAKTEPPADADSD